jgi:two-component system, cell cycle sensor histidine kinase and response regulator CckA
LSPAEDAPMDVMTERPRESDAEELTPVVSAPAPVVRLEDAHFRQMANTAPVMIWACDAHGGYTFFNEQWVSFTGLSRETLLYNPWLMEIHPEDYPAYRQQFLAAFQERVDFRAEYRLRRNDGRYRWLIDSGVPLFDEANEFIGYIGNCVDITDRKAMEDALAQSERKFKLLFDLSADAQVLLDGERVVDCNPASVAFFCVNDRWTLIGRAATEFLSRPEGASGALGDYIHEALARNSSRFEWNALRADGAEVPVELLLTCVPVGARTLLHAVIRDLTGRRALETRLRQAEKMEAIGTLAGGIAHDFNNLLAAIMGYTELALLDIAPAQASLPPEAMRISHPPRSEPPGAPASAASSLGEALTAAKRARDLVQQILTFSRHDDVRRTETDLGRVVQESVRLLRASIPTTIEINIHTAPNCVVLGNGTQLQQVLLNLGANAEHAMRTTGGGELEITLSRGELDEASATRFPNLTAGATVAKLTVRDTGTGMPERVRDRVFDPFFTTKPVGEGTGMGLSVVHGIITSHGGAIAVDSEPGRGTTFTLVFPCLVAASARPSMTPFAAFSMLPKAHGRVLVVEDEVTIGRMFRRLLQRLGYDAEVFDNGHDALELFRIDPTVFDLVITDLTMPGMTGDELAVQILKLRPEIPIVLATGYGPALSDDRARRLGISTVLRKPLTLKELTDALRVALGERGVASAE